MATEFKKITGLWACKGKKNMWHVRITETIVLKEGESILIQKNQFKESPDDPDYVIIRIVE